MMKDMYDESCFDALILWAFDPPPMGRPGIAVPEVSVGGPGAFPCVTVLGQRCPVIGITPFGWLSAAGPGWCRFGGSNEEMTTIAGICTSMQHNLARDRSRVNAGLRRYMALPDHNVIGGLPVITLANRRSAVRIGDILDTSVRTALLATLHDAITHPGTGRPMHTRSVGLPPGYINADFCWWWWCRNKAVCAGSGPLSFHLR